MSPLSGSPDLLKGAFVHFATPGASPVVLVFPYNPETLTRTVQPDPLGPATINAVPGNPQETIVFTLALDGESVPSRVGIPPPAPAVYPVLSALELLMYPAATAGGSLTLFVWGKNRILPVRVAGLRIVERIFSPDLSPLQATVEVTLVVASTDLAGTGYLQQHIAALGSLAASAYSSSFSPLGIPNL
jgi:hypothetical protein